jgi:hypothetical protein
LLASSEEMDILFSTPGSAVNKRKRTLEIIRGERHENQAEKATTVEEEKAKGGNSPV